MYVKLIWGRSKFTIKNIGNIDALEEDLSSKYENSSRRTAKALLSYIQAKMWRGAD